MISNYDLIILLMGLPQDYYQTVIVYICSGVLTIIEIMYFLYIFKLIASFTKA